MDERPGIEGSESRVSRRRIIQRIGAGTALAWSAPVLQSLASPTYAQASPTATCSTCSDDPCFGQTLCEESPNSCFGGVCGCVKTTEGDCFCYCNFACGSTSTCASSSDCPSGQRCSTLTCCGPQGVCLPACPNPAPFSTNKSDVEPGRNHNNALGV
jgi:hypothetical protein